MSMPISATTTLALTSLKPGMVLSSLAACRKGFRPRPTSVSMAAMALSSASMWVRCSLSMKRWCALTRPRSASSNSRAAGLDAGGDARGQVLGIAVAVDERLQHRAPALAQDVAEHDAELEVGVLQHLLDALDVRGALAHELLARARQRAQLLHRRRRHEAGADQAVGQQIGQPHRVVDVGLAPGHVLHVRGVGQHQLEVAFEHMPHRLPVHAGGLHRDVLDAEGVEPVGQLQQARGGGGKGAHFLQRRAVAGDAHAGHDRLLVHVQSRAARVDDFHDRLRSCLQIAATSACGPRHRSLKCVLRDIKPQATVRGAREAAGPTDIRVRSTKYEPTSVPDAAAPYYTPVSCVAGRAKRGGATDMSQPGPATCCNTAASSCGRLLATMWLVAISKYCHAGEACAWRAACQKAALPVSVSGAAVALM